MKVLTWNVACLAASASAPASWTSSLQKQHVLDILLTSQADIICLQELECSLHDSHLDEQYYNFGFAPSHCGHVQLLVKKNSGIDIIDTIEDGPAVLAVMIKDGQQFFCVSCHLAPFKDGTSHRLYQLRTLSEMLHPGAPVVVAGDFNLRENETEAASSVLRCSDAFQLAGCPQDDKFTWDSRRNKYHQDGFGYTCRYDRVFVRGWRVGGFQLVANQPVSGNRAHFLSDHFGLLVDLELDAAAHQVVSVL